jgi:ATP-dependent helicase/nuclease subunit A
MNWTPEQQKVIDLRNRNILVSAAAGSGKTAVLVSRIITMVSEGENPIDIDRLLIVTFTNAAAAEMRERIGAAIEDKIKEMPDNLHLQKQITLIHSAQITTIHSFCLNVIRNHFNTINLDPSFRIADEAELTLLKSDVIGDLLEEYYDKGEEEFLDFIESFSTGKSDAIIEELILKLHNFSMSYPWPEEWLEEKKKTFAITTVEDMNESDWMKALLNHIEAIVSDLILRCKEAIHLCEEFDGPKAYIAALRSDLELISDLTNLKRYDSYMEVLANFTFARLSSKKEEGVSEEKKNQVKLLRDEIKKAINDLKKNYFFQSLEEMVEDIHAMQGPMETLINLTMDFSNAYAKKKSDKNIVDFNDLEHFALNILVQKAGDDVKPTHAADELSEHYYEILIDEYQDSNLVQETILNSISGERNGRPNLFMVGDVKQSIYRFRLARPEIFMGKYDTYDLADSLYQRIDLHKNFRSRAVVLNSINYIFEQIMTKKLGNILYDHQVALYPGADYDEELADVSKDTEILLVDVEPNQSEDTFSDSPHEEMSPEDEEYTTQEIEAKAIAKRIKELTDETTGIMVFNKKKQSYQRAVSGDIVILLRTMSNWAETFSDTLAAEGILAHTETQSGYFSTLEIRTVLNLLRIIDNPRQDIPFTAVLRSPIVDLCSNDLALIRIPRRRITMYEAVVEYCKNESGEITKKLTGFLNKLNQYRDMVYYLSIHELILKVLDDTGYYNFISAMPAGEKRRANVDMLVQRAIRFEATSYSGLFHFVRYIEKLHKYDVDFGEAEIASDSENTVKIMSIHKSKGLEFPIVFVAGMGKSFNNQDSRSNLLIHPDLGLGPDYLNHELRVKGPTLVKKVIQNELVLENLGEELRILYVAMTRAKEKLILTGGVKKLNDKLVKWSNVCRQEEKQLLFYQLSNAKTYLDWIIPATMRHRGCEELLNNIGVSSNKTHSLYNGNAEYKVGTNYYGELASREFAEQVFKRFNQEDFINWDNTISYNDSIRDDIVSKLEFEYPYLVETKLHTKLTVSELKRLGQVEPEEMGMPILEKNNQEGNKQEENNQEENNQENNNQEGNKQEIYPVPNFISHKAEIVGANLGTLYHTVLEHLDLPNINTKDDIKNTILDLVHIGKMTEENIKVIDVNKLYSFSKSSIAERMVKAKLNNQLYVERQFIMGMKAKDIDILEDSNRASTRSDELVLIQGVIDVYFEEDDQWVLVDYKTDYVNVNDGEEILKKRYAVQLNYYQKALEQLTGRSVKEKIIYSFGLGKEISIS